MARLVRSGAEINRAAAGQRIARHHHEGAYAALVLRGGYLEAGDRGRIMAHPGDVIFHEEFDGHCNSVAPTGAEILNLSLTAPGLFPRGVCSDPDAVARLAERNLRDAANLLISTTVETAVDAIDWPDALAEYLRLHQVGPLAAWADAHCLSPSELSRGFRSAYGVTPKRFRLELRAAAAARAIRRGTGLSEAAFAAGFADQPHMTRTFGGMFGSSPGKLRH